MVLEDAAVHARVFAEEPVLTASSFLDVLDEPGADIAFALLAQELKSREQQYFSLEQARVILKQVTDACKEQGIKGKSIFKPLRVALTSRDQGPDLFFLIAGLGRSRMLARLQQALGYLAQRGGNR